MKRVTSLHRCGDIRKRIRRRERSPCAVARSRHRSFGECPRGARTQSKAAPGRRADRTSGLGPYGSTPTGTASGFIWRPERSQSPPPPDIVMSFAIWALIVGRHPHRHGAARDARRAAAVEPRHALSRDRLRARPGGLCDHGARPAALLRRASRSRRSRAADFAVRGRAQARRSAARPALVSAAAPRVPVDGADGAVRRASAVFCCSDCRAGAACSSPRSWRPPIPCWRRTCRSRIRPIATACASA